MYDKIDVNEFYKGLDELFRQKKPDEAMAYMEAWLAKAKRGKDTSGIVAISNELGGFCRVTGRTARAKELYETVLFHLKEMGFAGTEHYATALMNFGDVYVNTRELEQALSLFLQARALLQKCGVTRDYRMAALSNNISMVYRDTGCLDQAEEALDVAFHIIKGMPQCRGELAVTYTNLGELQVRQGKLEMAKENFLQAVTIFEETGGGDVHYSSACAGLGQACSLQGDRDEAIKWYEKALALTERDFGKTDSYRHLEAALASVKGLRTDKGEKPGESERT